MQQPKLGEHIHLMGICGTAMASLAGLLKQLGCKVTGSDENIYPPMSTQLEALNIPILLGFSEKNLIPKPDLVIVGNVISRSNPEAQALLASDIPYTSLPKALGEFVIKENHSVVVSGTHGKTTSTAMLVTVAEYLKLDGGFLIGGIPQNDFPSFKTPVGDWFFIEGDEYDTAFFDKVPKFIHYKPRSVILTSVEFDHADIYSDIEDVKKAFKTLVGLIPETGLLLVNAGDPVALELASHAASKVLTFGLNQGDYQAEGAVILSGRQHFGVLHKGKRIADIAMKVFGDYNILNALSVFVLARELGWDLSSVLQGLSEFKGVKRRQEVIGEPGGIIVIEDFAHHPTAVRLTVETMKSRYPGHKLFCVFEPRSATSRRVLFQKDYADAFAQGDVVFVSTPYKQDAIPEAERFSAQVLVDDLLQRGGEAKAFDSVDEIVMALGSQARRGDIVLIMSNGGFGDIYKKLLKRLDPGLQNERVDAADCN